MGNFLTTFLADTTYEFKNNKPELKSTNYYTKILKNSFNYNTSSNTSSNTSAKNKKKKTNEIINLVISILLWIISIIVFPIFFILNL